ncbi:threonine synthase [Paenibacillus eucommiae]|uniref:Threonine synthase n=1 Tax=Paenibacillus eucommiae TaxID=1355755 RepID=A0ABS4IPL7_9BACL|nr:threonine synthase [Paenibacillus eucommiae]MBP1989110.1 threonine synthase [Paenibacillus eucommiae]
MQKFALICLRCGKYEPFAIKGRCACGGTMLVDYDLELISRTIGKEMLPARVSSMWRYKELLPVTSQDSIVSLGEGWTPLIRMPALERDLELDCIWLKREEQNPTGSFKARGFSTAISVLKEHGFLKPAVPSNGNAASALAAYAAYANMHALVIVPSDCPGVITNECLRYGAAVFRVKGYIHDAANIIEEGKAEQGWLHVGTLREPGRVEGKKTMGLELAEQLLWELPDVIVYPTGGGSGIIGLWKAFRELKQLKWVSGNLPRFISVQEAGCQPIVDSLHQPADEAAPQPEVTSSPTGLRVPNPPDQSLIVSIIKETGGSAVSVSRDQIAQAQTKLGLCGISASPEGAATLAGLQQACERGLIHRRESVVLINTSHADKYIDYAATEHLPVIDSYQELKTILAQSL